MKIADPSKRVDRIYLRAAVPARAPCILRVGLFGKGPTNSLGIVPSDHDGLFADLNIPRRRSKQLPLSRGRERGWG